MSMVQPVMSEARVFDFFFQAEDGIRDRNVTGVQTCALPICLRYALEKADATLHSFSEITARDGTPTSYVIEWSERGQTGQTRRYRSTIDPGLTVVSSGICLSGRERDFDLTSLVSVMTDSPWT